jgi:hypothetical protein
LECLEKLYKIQVGDGNTYKICVVDSDSSNLMYYSEVEKTFPEVEINLVKNNNYEYGAWKYMLNKYSNYDVYFCIQDSNIIHHYIDISIVSDSTAYIFYNKSGFCNHTTIQERAIDYLEKGTLDYKPVINTYFNLAQHSSFIVNRKTLADIFVELPEPPVDKEGSCIYERNFGLYFIIKGFTTMNLYENMSKMHLGRL